MNPLRLEQMTVFDVAPEHVVDIAVELGIPLVSFCVVEAMPGARPVTQSNKRPVLERLRNAPVKVDTVEVFVLRPDPLGMEAEIALAAELGASAIIALHLLSGGEQEAAEQLAALCTLAASYDLLVSLEPISMGLTRTIAEAQRVVRLSGAPNARLTLDLLHIVRTGTPVSEVTAIDPALISSAQVCDGPAIAPADLIEEAGYSRAIPGSGDFPIAQFLELLPDGVPLGLEVPLKPLREAGVSAAERTRLVLDAVRRSPGPALQT